SNRRTVPSELPDASFVPSSEIARAMWADLPGRVKRCSPVVRSHTMMFGPLAAARTLLFGLNASRCVPEVLAPLRHTGRRVFGSQTRMAPAPLNDAVAICLPSGE